MAKSKAETLHLDRKIWDLKLAGLGTTQIAQALELTPQQLSKRLAAVKAMIQPEIQDAALSHVALRYARLERLIRANWPKAIGRPAVGIPGMPGYQAGIDPNHDAATLVASLMRDQDAIFKLSIGGGKTLPPPAGTDPDQAGGDEEANADAVRSTLLDRLDRVIAARRAQASSGDPEPS